MLPRLKEVSDLTIRRGVPSQVNSCPEFLNGLRTQVIFGPLKTCHRWKHLVYRLVRRGEATIGKKESLESGIPVRGLEMSAMKPWFCLGLALAGPVVAQEQVLREQYALFSVGRRFTHCGHSVTTCSLEMPIG